MDNNPYFKLVEFPQVHVHEYFAGKNKYKLCLSMVWYEHTNPNQTTTLAMEQRKKDKWHKNHSLRRSGQTN